MLMYCHLHNICKYILHACTHACLPYRCLHLLSVVVFLQCVHLIVRDTGSVVRCPLVDISRSYSVLFFLGMHPNGIGVLQSRI